MKQHKVIALILVLAVLTGIAAWVYLGGREEVAEGTLEITYEGQVYTVSLSELDCEPMTGIRVNGKGEEIPVNGQGILLNDLFAQVKITPHSKVMVISDDSYSAELTADEVCKEGKAYLLLQDEELRLVVFGDTNSKRSVSNVVQVVVE